MTYHSVKSLIGDCVSKLLISEWSVSGAFELVLVHWFTDDIIGLECMGCQLKLLSSLTVVGDIVCE